MSDGNPTPALFEAVVGQEDAVAALRAAVTQPVHAYLFRGPAGNGGLAAAHAFAAALLCPDGGCGDCPTCRRAVDGSDPDLHLVHRSGATLSVDDMRRLVALAQRRPLQASRQVVVVTDVHLGGRAAPALLKTLEEPPGDTVFVLLADDVTPELATVASRCVTGAGVVAAELARSLLESADRAVEPLRAEHARQLENFTEEAKEMGERGLPGRKEITDQQQREERRWRTDALRAGMGALARAYRDRLVALTSGGGTSLEVEARAAAEAVALITDATRALPRNPNDSLLLQSLLVRLGALGI
jgi:hypothetical protein